MAVSQVTWINPAGGNWFTTGNWSGNALPVSTSSVIINNGGSSGQTLVDQAGAVAQGLILGETSKTGALEVTGAGTLTVGSGEFSIGDKGVGLLTISNGGKVTSASAVLANYPGTTGTALIKGTGSQWTVNSTLYIAADTGAVGTLTVESGGKLQASSQVLLGSFDPTASGTLTVQGTGSSFVQTVGSLTVGNGGLGYFNLLSGATASTAVVTVGAASSGTAVISGNGTAWSTGNFLMGSSGAGIGTVTVSDQAKMSTVHNLMGATSAISSGQVTVQGAGSEWNISGVYSNLAMTLGRTSATGSLSVLDGGKVTIAATATNGIFADVRLGGGANSTAVLLVSGTGSTFSTPYNLYVGNNTNAKGTMTISAGGTVNSGFSVISSAADASATTTDVVTITGPGSVWNISNTQAVAADHATGMTVGSTGRGVLTLADGGKLKLNNSDAFVVIGGISGSQGTINIGADAASVAAAPGVIEARAVLFATTTPGPLVFTFNHTSNNYVFAPQISGSGPGIVNIVAGTTIFTNDNTYTGTTTVSSGATLQFGNGGTTGSINKNVTVNGTLIFNRSNTLTFAQVVSGSGAVVQSGSGTTILTGNNTYLGGTTVNAGKLQIGNVLGDGAFVGDVVNNGTFTFYRTSALDYAGVISGTGILEKMGNGILTLSGVQTSTGGTRISAGTLRLAASDRLVSTGAVTVSGTGTFSLNGFNQTVGDLSSTGGTIAIGAGTLTAGATASTSITSQISGNGAFIKQGAGTLTITGTKTFSGTTTVSAGKLQLNGNMSAGSFTVNSGATLAGTGSAGATTIQNGGILAPGSSPGTFTVTSLLLNNSSILEYELASPGGVGDLIQVTGNLTLDGVLNVTGLTGFTTGIYRLMNYGGTLVDNILSLGTQPSGYDFTVSAGAGQVNLLIQTTGSLGLQFWDGPNTTANNTVDGGTGTWNYPNTNWATASGAANGAWVNGTAVLSGSAGTITLGADITFQGIQFVTSGYVIESGGFSLLPSGVATFRVDGSSGVGTINAPLGGSGAVVKSGPGRLVLNAASTYLGGTTLQSGLLVAGGVTQTGGAGSYQWYVTALGAGAITLEGGTLGFSPTLGDPVNGAAVNSYHLSNSLTASANFGLAFATSASRAPEVYYLDGNLALGADDRTTRFGHPDMVSAPVTRVHLSGIISGGGGLTLESDPLATGTHVVTFEGTTANSYAGMTTVKSSIILELDKGAANGAIPGDLVVESGGQVVSLASEQIADDAGVTFNGGALTPASLLMDETIGTLNGNGILELDGYLSLGGGEFSGSLQDSATSAGDLVKTGGAILVLSGASTYTGGTGVVGGTLKVLNTSGTATGSGPVMVRSGATLTGAGTVAGPVTVESGGSLTPGDGPETIAVGSLILNASSNLNFELGGLVNDRILVTDTAGQLVLDGVLNFPFQRGFGSGVYRLIDYPTAGTFSFSNNLLATGVVPSGFTYEVNTATAGQVNLLVDPGSLRFWDGPGNANDGVVQGGTGFWNTSSANWANAGGTANTVWDQANAVSNPRVAIFGGTASVVTLQQEIFFDGLQFLTDGYVIEPGGFVLHGGTDGNTNIRTEAGVAATIHAPLVIETDLGKYGAGTLVLTGGAASDGDYYVEGGTLEVQGGVVSSDFGGVFVGGTGAQATTSGVLRLSSGASLDTQEVKVWSGSRLEGAGQILSTVTVNNAATIAPRGSLATGALELNETTVLDYALGAPGDSANSHLQVDGALVLNGLLNITDNGGFTTASYRLIDYSGFLTNGGLTLQSVPVGFNAGDFSIDAATTGQVNLVVGGSTGPSGPGSQYWDGSFPLANSRIDGGSGVWSLAGTNWTNFAGNVNGQWSGMTAIFAARAGTVVLADDIPFRQLNFEVDGYRIESAGRALVPLGDAGIEVVGAATTRILAPLVGSGTLTKSGSGELILAGAQSSVVAGTFVEQGRLSVNTVLRSPFVNVEHAGTLGGNGLIIGNVSNDGIVAPGNSIGTLAIRGNFRQSRQGTLEIEVGSLSHFDQLVVSGTARLSGTLKVTGKGHEFEYGDLYPFLHAGRITGRFSRINVPDPSRLRGRFFAEGGTGILLIAPASYTLVAQTPNQTRLAKALDRWIGIEAGEIGAATLALDLLREEQYPAAFEALLPGYYDAALRTGIELSHNHGQLLHQQLSARRLGQRTLAGEATSAPAPTVGSKNPKAVQKVASPIQPPLGDDARWNAWVQGSGLFSSGGLSLTPGEDFESGTILVGADYALSEHFALGLFASYQEGWGDYANGGETDLESVRFGLYATIDHEGFYANAAVGGGTTDYSIVRPLSWASLDRTARSNPDASEFFSLIGTGYDFQFGNFTVGPQLSAQYTHLEMDGVKETGAGVLNLGLDDSTSESFRTYLGGRLAYTLHASETVTIIPELRVFWQHEFLQDDETLHARLDGGRGPGFEYRSSNNDRDAVFVGAGVGVQVGTELYFNVYYNADFGRGDDGNHAVSASMNFKF